MRFKLLLQAVIVLLAMSLSVQSAFAITVLGLNPFYSEKLTSESEAKQVLLEQKDDVKTGLMLAGNGELYEPLVAQLSDAEFTRATYAKGQVFKWMFYRKDGRGKVRVDKHLIWEGDGTIEAFQFFVDYDGQRYTFALPLICTNLALLNTAPVPAAAPPTPAVSSGQSTGGNPGTGEVPPAVPLAAPVEDSGRFPIIVDAGYLKLLDPGNYVFARIGLEYPLNDNFSIIGMIGGAHQYEGLDGTDAFLADILANYNFSRFFVAAGLGGWITSSDNDLDSDDSDLDVILNVGARIFGEPDAFNTSLFLEVRSAVDEMSDFDLYGRIGAGLRFRF